ncbi:hypothetical protein KIPB_011512, partial [Kipferlia bialata]|eukprot:g11512.t1
MNTHPRVTFQPDDQSDYELELFFAVATGHISVPVFCIGTRPNLHFPEAVSFGRCPVQMRSTKTVYISNSGEKDATFTLLARPSQFGCMQSKVTVPRLSGCQVDLTYTPTACEEQEGDLIVTFPQGESRTIPLSGSGKAIDVSLSADTVSMGPIHVYTIAQAPLLMRNDSDSVARYKWRRFPSAGHALASTLSSGRGHEGDREREIDTESLEYEREREPLYQCEEFDISPLSGELYPSGAISFRVKYSPQVAGDHTDTVYLEVEGQSERIPVTLQGSSIPPVAQFSCDVLDINTVCSSETAVYPVTVENIGGIPATLRFADQSGPLQVTFSQAEVKLEAQT